MTKPGIIELLELEVVVGGNGGLYPAMRGGPGCPLPALLPAAVTVAVGGGANLGSMGNRTPLPL